jgi:hypothetical protein
MHPKARKNGVLSEQLGGETIVFDAERQKAHSLNHSASIVWRHSNGERSVAELATVLGTELGIEPDESLVEYAIDELARANLLEPPANGSGVTRRDAVRRLSFAGAVAVGLPVVLSIIAPTPAVAASGTVLPPDPGPD